MFNKKRVIFLLLIHVLLIIGLTVIYAGDVNDTSSADDIVHEISYDNYCPDSFQSTVNYNKFISKNYDNVLSEKEENEKRYVYVNSFGNSSCDGSDYANPTTFDNAWSTVNDNDVILLLGDDSSVYNMADIKTSYLKSNVRTITITSDNKSTVLNFLSGANVEIGSGYNVLFENLTFMRNEESNSSLIYNNGNLILNNCSFNTVRSSFNKSLIYNNNTLLLNDCEFINNNASKGLIYNEKSKLTMNHCLFEDNVGESGVLSSVKSNIYVYNCSFIRNNASFGGIFLIRDGSLLNVNKSSFINNSAIYYGGVINSWYSSSLFDNSLFINNFADIGGIVYSANNIQTKIINSLMENNTACIAGNVYSFSDRLVIDNNAIISQGNDSLICCYNTSYFLDNNWWGVNNPDFSRLTNNLLPNNWRVMTVDSEFNDTSHIIIVSISHLTNDEVLNKALFNRSIHFTTDNGVFAFENSSINSSITNEFTGNLDDLYVRIDNQVMRINDKLVPFISINNISAIIDENVTFVVQCNPDINDSIHIKVNDVSLMDMKPYNGLIRIDYVFNDSWNPGDYVLSASLTDSDKYCDLVVNVPLLLKDDTDPIVNIVSGNDYSEESVTVKGRLSLDTARTFQTSVKNQKTSGSCWAFAALGTLESAYLKAYGIEYDFSENNMKNVLKKYSIIGEDDNPSGGNKELEPISYLVGWYGPVNESMDPYDEYSIMSPLLNSSIKVEDVYFYYRTSYAGRDNKFLKEAITRYGAIASSIYSGYSTSSARSIYKTDTPYSDHAISIVGWDDFYSLSNFYGMNKPEDNGAYIIKNSWGESIGDDGYQYVSYYDTSLAGVNLNYVNSSFSYAFPVQGYENYTNIYQHDTVSTCIIPLSPSAWIRNVYTAKEDESIAGIGTYIYDDCDYEAYVYVNDRLCYSQNGTFTQEGYRIIKLKEYVSLKRNDKFRVDLRLKVHQGSNTMITIQNTNRYKSISHEKQSFISNDGENWIDLYYNSEYPASCACLKVYTKDVPTINSSLMNQSDNYIITTCVDNLKSSGRLCYMMGDSYYNDSEGNILYVPITENGSYTVMLHPHNYYNYNLTVNLEIGNCNVSEKFEIRNPLEVEIVASNYSYCLGELQEINVSLNVINADNMTLTDGKVYLYENSVLVDECDVINGSVRFIVNNNIGDYEYLLVYTSSEEFVCENVTLGLSILENDAVIMIDDIENVLFNDTVNISGTLKSVSMKDIDGDIVLNINGMNYDVQVIGGVFNYEYTANLTGMNNVSAYFDGNNIYSNSNCFKNFEVYKRGTRIVLDSVDDVAVNNSVKISGKILDDIDRNIEIDKINMTINNSMKEVTINHNSYFEYSFKVKYIGINEVTVNFAGNTNYIGSTNNTTFKVKQINTKITSNITYETATKQVRITGTLNDENNNKISNEQILIKINNETHYLNTDNNGIINYTEKIERIGINNASIIYEGNYYYNSTMITETFNVPKKNVILTVNNIENIKYMENMTINGELTDENYNIMKNESIIISVNNAEYTTLTNNNGNYNLTIRAKNLGINNITIKYHGNNKYNSYEINITANIEKQDINITYDTIQTIKYKDNLTITGKVTDINQNPIKNINTIITINSKLYKAKTDNTGTYTFTTTANNIGTNNVTISYAGNTNYNSYQTNTSFNVEKQDINITYDTIQTIKYKDNLTISGKVIDVNEKGLLGINVIITINEKLYKAKTDSTGAFTLTATASATGTNNVTLGYGGNTNYNAYQTSTIFNVEKQDINIIYDTVQVVKYKDNITVTGKVIDVNKNPVKNINTLITLNNRVYKAKTDNTGTFTFTTLATSMGTNNMTISYAGNTNYNSYQSTTTFNVEKQDIIITYDTIEDVLCGENVTITGKIMDINRKGLYNINVLIHINGKLSKVKTDSDGSFTFKTPLKFVGIQNVTLSYGGNDYYNGYETSTTFNVTAELE